MTVYNGRLAADGDGNLYADQSTRVGDETVKVFDPDGEPVLDDNGDQYEFVRPVFKYGKDHGKTVKHDLDAGSYLFVKKGELSHNEQHHKQFVTVDGTSEPLYNAAGELVIGGEPHHVEPAPDDPHYDASAPGKTRLQFDDDEIAATITGHTAAYIA